VNLIIAATHSDLRTTAPIVGARLVNAVQTQWRFTLSYSYVNIDSQAAKLNMQITLTRTPVTISSAMLLVALNCK